MVNRTTFFGHRKILLSVILTLGSLLTLPAYAWPEVDHMNMCGSAVKVARVYGGGFKGWKAHDTYTHYRERAGYYYRNNCPGIVAPVKPYKKKIKKSVVKKATPTKALKTKGAAKPVKIAKSSRVKSFQRKVTYDKHADCARVDKMNGSGPAVFAKRNTLYRLAN